MGETDLWDDSALINAFDQAVTKCKLMHTNTSHDDTADGEKSTNNENELLVTEFHSLDLQRNEEPDDKRNNNVEAATMISVPSTLNRAAHEVIPIQENKPEAGTCLPEFSPELGGATSTHDKLNSYEETEYAQLLGQYYEIEEKRQKILQQLQQMSYWNYPSSTRYQMPQVHEGTSTSQLGLTSSCCMCLGHCCACAISSSTCGSFCPGDACKSLPQAYEVTPEEKHKGREETSGVDGGQRSQIVDSETDLTVVMNAWYAAGFYTGRYLLEQSMKKGHH